MVALCNYSVVGFIMNCQMQVIGIPQDLHTIFIVHIFSYTARNYI